MPKRVKLDCAECRAEFETYPGWAKRGKHKYCGKACRMAANARFLRENTTRGRRHSETAREKMSEAARGRHVMERSSQWKGGRFQDKQGYVKVMIATLPLEQQPLAMAMAHKGSGTRYVSEHRLVAAVARGAPIGRDEVVHHKNGIKDDNRPENLEILPRDGHTKEHRLVENELALLRVEASRLRAENATLRAQVAALKSKKGASRKAGPTSLSLFS